MLHVRDLSFPGEYTGTCLQNEIVPLPGVAEVGELRIVVFLRLNFFTNT